MYHKRSKYTITEEPYRSIVAVSKIFQHGKTVVPAEVRRNLGLEDGDRLVWIFENGRWIVESSRARKID